jgi:hypothetical protein
MAIKLIAASGTLNEAMRSSTQSNEKVRGAWTE